MLHSTSLCKRIVLFFRVGSLKSLFLTLVGVDQDVQSYLANSRDNTEGINYDWCLLLDQKVGYIFYNIYNNSWFSP